MIIAIAYPNAARYYTHYEYYKNVREKLNNPKKRKSLPMKYDFWIDKRILNQLLEKDGFISPVHLMVPDDSLRVRTKDISSSVRPKNLPDDTFIEYNQCEYKETKEIVRFALASPELCFLQASTQLSLTELILFGYQLCADYYYDESAKYGFVYYSPATEQSRLAAFIERAKGMNGKKKAQQALPYIHDHARSPMEILQAMIVNLPISYGGFAMKGFELNGNADLSAEGKQILGFDTCRCDIVWKKQKVVLEYDSDQVHLDSIQHAKDKNRATALSVSGYKVFTLTTSDLHKVEKIEAVMFALRNALRMKKEAKQFQKFRKKRVELLDWVRGQMQSPDENGTVQS